MTDILHKIEIQASADALYRALATIDGLAGWWTSTTTGATGVGDTIEFRFNQHVVPMKVETSDPGRRVSWRCLDADGEWKDTKVTFDLTEAAGRTTLVFGHRAWKEQTPVYAHCSMKWATFLLSLRAYVETGAGKPFPHDVAV